MAVYDNTIFIIGGADKQDSWLNSVEKHNSVSNTWTLFEDFPGGPHSFPNVGVITDFVESKLIKSEMLKKL